MTAEIDKELLQSLAMPGLTITGDPDAIRRWHYYVLVGCFVQGWATLEYIFDLYLRVIFESVPGGHTLAKRLPRALAAKIKLFKDAHAKLERLKPNFASAQSIANIMEQIGDFRHKVFHSAQGFTDDQNIRSLRRMVLHDNKNAEARLDVSSQQMAELLQKIVGLLNPMTEYAKFLVTTFPTNKRG